MSANTEAINRARDTAWISMQWFTQDAAVVAVTAAPTAANEGVPLGRSSCFSFMVADNNSPYDADLEITIWGYADGAWGRIPGGTYVVDGPILEGTQNTGGAERVYIQVSAYTDGDVDLKVGVPRP
jgi:hypothetical protein